MSTQEHRTEDTPQEAPTPSPISLDRDTAQRLFEQGLRVHERFTDEQKSLRRVDDVELRFRYQ